jgi:dolichol-phosphate mannosyltransferase
MRPDLSVVIPLKDEQDVLPALYERLSATLGGLPVISEVVFVDDGSRDATPRLLARMARNDARVRVVCLSRNFGHQAAISAGLDNARGRAVVVMDGDLQDPPEVIPRLLDAWHAGNDVVYAVRRKRQEPWLKRLAYSAFYRLMRNASELDMPLDSGDFCLMDRRVVLALRRLPERSRFMRGLRRYVGFRQIGVDYDRPARPAGRSKYTLGRLIALACDGLVSFSSRPLRLATYLGLTTALAAASLTCWVVADALATHTAPRGWASTMIVVLFMGSVQLVCLGIAGEYLRQIFIETKRRPSYIIERRFGGQKPRRTRQTAIARTRETQPQ